MFYKYPVKTNTQLFFEGQSIIFISIGDFTNCMSRNKECFHEVYLSLSTVKHQNIDKLILM